MRALLLLTLLLLTGCDTGQPAEPPASASPSPASEVETAVSTGPSPVQMGQWTRNCALCHVRGEGGAPVLGDQAAWRERAAKGEEVLLTHTLEGFNNMPPLGYCMDCEADDFRALIRFMGGAQ